MKLFEITLPLNDNAGASYDLAHLSFQGKLLNIAGGYTQGAEAQGVWQDPESKQVFIDAVRTYRVATSPEKWASIIQEAGQLFADQLAFFHCELGTATITERISSAKVVA